MKLEYSSFTDKLITWEQYDVIADLKKGLSEQDNMLEFVIDVSQKDEIAIKIWATFLKKADPESLLQTL